MPLMAVKLNYEHGFGLRFWFALYWMAVTLSVQAVASPPQPPPPSASLLSAAVSATHDLSLNYPEIKENMSEETVSDDGFDLSLPPPVPSHSSRSSWLDTLPHFSLLGLFAKHNPRVEKDRLNPVMLYRFCIHQRKALKWKYPGGISECFMAVDALFPMVPLEATRLQVLYTILSAPCIIKMEMKDTVKFILEKTPFKPIQQTALLYYVAKERVYFNEIWNHFCSAYHSEKLPFSKYPARCQRCLLLLPSSAPQLGPFLQFTHSQAWKSAKLDFTHLNFVFKPHNSKTANGMLLAIRMGANVHGILSTTNVIFRSNDSETTAKFLRKLIEYGMDVNFHNGVTSILVCSLEGVVQMQWLEVMLQAGMDPDLPHVTSMETPLLEAYQQSNYPMAELLLAFGANPNVGTQHLANNRQGIRPLMLARDVSMVQLAVTKGANVHVVDEEGLPPLFYARTVDIARFLIDNGANPRYKTLQNETWLMIGCKHSDVLAFAISLDVINVNAVDVFGSPALHFAVCMNSTQSIHHLLRAGANINYQDSSDCNRTALMHMALDLDIDAAVLRGAGLNPDLADCRGMTLLMYAAKNGFIRVIIAILELDAELNMVDSQGNTALIWSLISGHVVVAETLIISGARTDISNNQGWNAEKIASKTLRSAKDRQRILALVDWAKSNTG